MNGLFDFFHLRGKQGKLYILTVKIKKGMLTYESLLAGFRRGIRNGNWKRLSVFERALLLASLSYAKIRKRIVSGHLSMRLAEILEKLKETPAMRVFRRGLEKACELLMYSERRRLFSWAPSLKEWLKDPNYIFWLGTVCHVS